MPGNFRSKHSIISRKSFQETIDDKNILQGHEPVIRVFRFLQLLCEGHFLKVQRYFILQTSLHVSINIVEATLKFLLDMYMALNATNALMLKQLFDTITEFCQVNNKLFVTTILSA